MTDSYEFNELGEMIRLALREQSIQPQGLNSSQTHGTLYPVGDPRNDEQLQLEKPKLNSHRLMRPRAGWR